MPPITLGLLEDEQPQAELLTGGLVEAGYEVFHCSSGDSFLAKVAEGRADILILDWQLPD